MYFRAIQFLQLVSVPKWNDHDVAGRVGISIEDDKAVPAAMDDARFMVVAELQSRAKYAFQRLLGAGDVGVPPGGKEEIHDG